LARLSSSGHGRSTPRMLRSGVRDRRAGSSAQALRVIGALRTCYIFDLFSHSARSPQRMSAVGRQKPRSVNDGHLIEPEATNASHILPFQRSLAPRSVRTLIAQSARPAEGWRRQRSTLRDNGHGAQKSKRQSQGTRTRPQAAREPPPDPSLSAPLLWDTRGRALPPPPRSPRRRQAG
jgi:hypothetical protein